MRDEFWIDEAMEKGEGALTAFVSAIVDVCAKYAYDDALKAGISEVEAHQIALNMMDVKKLFL